MSSHFHPFSVIALPSISFSPFLSMEGGGCGYGHAAGFLEESVVH